MTAQSVRGAAIEKREAPKSVTVARQYQTRFAEVLPEHIDAKAFVGAAVAALRRDEELLKAADNSPDALINTLLTCASLGHVPGSKEFYLTPRWNGRAKHTEIVGMEGYRGVVERMYRSGAVAAVIVREVCENDRFEFVEGVQDAPYHEIDWFGKDGKGRGQMIGVYAYARLVTGATSRVVVLSKDDVMEAKAASDLGKQDKGPWVTNERAMWLKTAAHRLEPWVPTSAEYRREVARAQAAAGEISPTSTGPTVNRQTGEIVDDGGDVVDAEVVEDNAGDQS
jgi:recombination protein RecT